MGRDKAGISYQGETLLQRSRTLLEQAGCRSIWISGRPEEAGGLRDSRPGGGPAHAILDALTAASGACRGILVVPVDMPLIEARDLIPLLEGDGRIAHAWDTHPLPAYFPAGLALPKRTGIWSVFELLGHMRVNWLEISDDRTGRFKNINTPDDLAAIVSRD